MVLVIPQESELLPHWEGQSLGVVSKVSIPDPRWYTHLLSTGRRWLGQLISLAASIATLDLEVINFHYFFACNIFLTTLWKGDSASLWNRRIMVLLMIYLSNCMGKQNRKELPKEEEIRKASPRPPSLLVLSSLAWGTFFKSCREQ